jgi:glyoxylase-like metal-dependent hydrolase (beta-lactamase superfamily II)
MLTRRDFLRSAAMLVAAQAATLVPVPAAAQAPAPAKQAGQAPGFFRLAVGGVEVTALYDGAGQVRPEILHGADPARLAALLEDAGLDPKAGEPIAINAFLLNTGANLVLVDAGGGTALGPRAGLLPGNLKAAGYAPEQITLILLTHMHPDHALGLMAPDGRPLFPGAVVRPAAAEAAYWLSDATLASAPEQRKASIQALRSLAAAYSALGKWKPFAPAEALAEGLAVEPLPGHTPGHCGFWVRSQGRSLLAFGDIVHSSAVQFAQPEVTIDFDVDQAQAKATRLALLPRLARESCWIAGSHLPFPGLGRVRARGKGYAWLPAPYAAPRG